MHTVYLAKLDRRTFVLLGAASVMKNSDEIVEDRFALFARELLEQQCLLLQSELVVMGEELSNARQQLDLSSTARS